MDATLYITRIHERNLLGCYVTVHDVDHRVFRAVLQGLYEDDHGTLCAVVLSDRHPPFCQMVHVSRIEELQEGVDQGDFRVLCRKDQLPDGSPGPHVLATSQVFTSYQAADQYRRSIAASRDPIVVAVVKNG